MKLSTRSRYGTRMILDLAEHYDEGPVQMGDIAKRQNISVKYLEQLIIPLKKNNYIKSVRGPKGGHMLARPPERITVGEVVKLLEGGTGFTQCIEDPSVCDRSEACSTRSVWKAAAGAMHKELHAITLSEMVRKSVKGKRARSGKKCSRKR